MWAKKLTEQELAENEYSHVSHNDILSNNGPHIQVDPQDYNETENFLLASDITVMETS